MTSDIDLRAAVAFLRRRFWLIFGIFLLSLASAAAYVFTATPIYTASALVMVNPSGQSLLHETQGSQSASDARVEAEVLLARSDSVLLAVIEGENLLQSAEYQSRPPFPVQLASFFGMREPTPASPDQTLGSVLTDLRGMVSVERQRGTYLLNILARSQQPDSAASLANAVATAYIEHQMAAKAESSMDARRLLAEQVAAARHAMLESASTLDRYVEANLTTIQGMLPDSSLAELEARIRQLDAWRLPPQVMAELYDLQQLAKISRRYYDQLFARAQQLQAEATLQLPDSRVVSAALVPTAPSAPNKRSMLSLSAALGLAAGLALAFLYEHFIGGITSEEQLASLARTREALVVPWAKLQPNWHSLSDLLLASPSSPFSEAIRRIRATFENGLAMRPKSRGSVIVVTSSSRSEGKTTLALALARSCALAGRNTILIDGDRYLPSVHAHLGLAPSDGVLNALTSIDPPKAIATAMVRDVESGLLVLVGSHARTNGSEQLITNQHFDQLITTAAESFDVVVIDTPPLGLVVDGLHIAKKADAVLFVAQSATVGQHNLRRTLLSLESALSGDALLIPVLNRHDLSSSDYRGGDYTAESAPISR